MQDRVTRGAWLLLAGALGCGAGEDVWIGSEIPLRSERADAGSEDAGPSVSYPPAPEVKHCSAEPEGELEIDFELDVATPVCPEGSGCQLDVEQLVPADDGSLWVRGARRPRGPSGPHDPRHVWLAHISAEGALLGTTELPGDSFTSDLAVDDRGRAWLAIWPFPGQTGASDGTRIHRFDAAVQPLGAPVALEDWRNVRMANAPGQGVVVTGFRLSDYERLTGLLDADGMPRWTKLEPHVGLLARPVVDPSGQIVIPSAAPGGIRGDYFGDEAERGATNLQAYDGDGAVLWSRDMIREVSGTSLDWWFFGLTSDALGGLTVAASETAAGAGPFQGWVLRLSAEGVPQWLWQLPVGANTPVAVDLPTGRTFVADHLINTQSEPFNYEVGTMTVISADGTTCRKYGYTGVHFMDVLASSAAGELFFGGTRTVGRFRPILGP